jgi:Fe-S oxidoreductase/nitrate reductase gamma subunit
VPSGILSLTELHRITYDLMPALTALIMYIVLSGFAAIFFYGICRRLRIYLRGSSLPRFDRLAERICRSVVNAFAQKKVLRKCYPGIMHLFIYSGIVVLFIGTTLVMLNVDFWEVVFHSDLLVGNFYLFFELFLDAFGFVAITGLVLAIYRRTVLRPQNLPSARDDVYIFTALLTILFTGYVMEGVRLAVDKPRWAPWSFIGYQVALLLETSGLIGQLASAYQGLWWFHALLAFAVFASIPYTKLFHIITSPLNALFADIRPKGQLSMPFDLRQLLASGNFDVKIGAAAIGDFSWHKRLSFDSCTSCGRCTNECPAAAAGTALSPMHLILKLRNVMFSHQHTDGGSVQLVGGVVDQEELWACTTCQACVNECPVLIDHIDAIVDMRRHLITEGKLDRAKRDLLTNLNKAGNPYGLAQSDRMKWAEGLGVKAVKDLPDFEVLYWVGCSGSYDPRNQSVSKAMVRILNAADVRFAVLGNEEKCNCEVARRVGEEGRFQQSAMELVELFKKYNVKLILTQCPHCFNTFKNEYPALGVNLQVVHHSQFIAQLIESGKLKLRQETGKIITFHDPCYLGRCNGIYDSPRDVVKSLGPITLKEMARSKDHSFCCGGGGANFWYEVAKKKKASQIRFEEAQQLKGDVLATACPFCTSMLEDAAVVLGAKEPRIRDIAELVAELIESP